MVSRQRSLIASGLPSRPDWRFDALVLPYKYNLKKHVSTSTESCKALHRFISEGIDVIHNHKLTLPLTEIHELLNEEQKAEFAEYYRRYLKRSKKPQLVIVVDKQKHKNMRNVYRWNMGSVDKINDKFLVKAIKHISNYEFNQEIDYAIKLSTNPSFKEIFKFIGYGIYAGASDAQLAKRWRVPIKKIEAIRLLFFDFSSFPKDRIAAFTYLRWLVSTGLLTEEDFAYYRRIYELGELGLRAQLDYHNLTKEEKSTVKQYIGDAVTATALNLHISITGKDDAKAFINTAAIVSRQSLVEHETTARIDNLRANTERVKNMVGGNELVLNDTDEKYMKILEALSTQEAPPMDLPTLADLQ